MRTFPIAVFLAALVSAIPAATYAQNPKPGNHHMMKDWLMTIPDLNQDQKQKITDLENTAKGQTAPLLEQKKAIHKELATLWAADQVDRQALAEKQNELDGVHGKIKGVWTDFFLQLHDVLTPTQRAWVALHGPAAMHGHKGGTGMEMPGECNCGQ